MNSNTKTQRNSLRWDLEHSLENFFQNTNTLFQNFSNSEKKYLEDNIKNIENFIKTHPLIAIAGLKFPENQTHFFDENFSFDTEIMWNYRIDEILKTLETEENNENLKKIITKIQEKMQRMIENSSYSKTTISEIKNKTSEILDK